MALKDQEPTHTISRRAVDVAVLAGAVGLFAHFGMPRLGRLADSLTDNSVATSQFNSSAQAETVELAPEEQTLLNLLKHMKENPNSAVREAAENYPQVGFTTLDHRDYDSQEPVVVLPNEATDNQRYQIVVNKDYLVGDHAGKKTQEQLQMSLYKAYFILKEAEKSPMRYGPDRSFSANLDQKAQYVGEQLFPQAAQGMR